MAYTKSTGTTLSIGGGNVLQLVSINGPSAEVRTVETTHLGSVDGAEYCPTVYSSGTVDFEAWYDPTAHNGPFTSMKTPEKQACSIVFADDNSTTMTFDAILTSYEISSVESENVVTVSGSLQITKDITITSGV